jgi:hypothetical protein
MAESKSPVTPLKVSRAERFPLNLPVALRAGDHISCTQTQDISASGLSFELSSGLEVGALVDLTISLPAGMMGVQRDVQLLCQGRVVRSYGEDGRYGVGVVIDDYHFAASDEAPTYLHPQ